MAGKCTALLMAVLMAVPFCCCLAKAAPDAPAAREHACCHKAADGDPSPAGTESSAPCDCHDASKKQLDAATAAKPAPPQWTLLSEISWERLMESAAGSGSDVRRALESPEAARPPGRVLLQVHCRYLL